MIASAKPANGKPKAKTKTKPAPKPLKSEQTSLRALADQTDALARPRITVPDANSDVDGDVNLAVKGQVNILGAGYVLEVYDGETLVGSSKADPDDSGMVLFTVSADLLEAGKTYTLRLLMNPDDGTTPPNLDHEITITTGGLQTVPNTPPPLIE
jgi:hypothetical protein